MKTAGIVIFIVGLLMTMYTGFSFFTKEKVVDLGEIKITKDNEHSIHWQPYVGVGGMIIGGILFVMVNKKSLT